MTPRRHESDAPTEHELCEMQKRSHGAPCPWTMGSMAAVGLLVTVCAPVLGVFWVAIGDLRTCAGTNATNIRELQTDTRWIRESVGRIEAALDEHIDQSRPPGAAIRLPLPGSVATV